MTTTTDIHSVLHGWILHATGIGTGKAVPDKENSPEPTGLFFRINSSAGEGGLGLEDERFKLSSTQKTTLGHRERSCSLHAFGPGAFEAMSAVKLTQDTAAVKALFKTAGLELIETGNIRDLSAVKNSRTEERSQMDVRIRFALRLVESIDPIAGIEYDVRVGSETISDSVSAS